MIADKFITFLKNNDVGLSIATRNSDLTPSIGRPFNAIVSEDRKNITFYMPSAMLRHHLENVQDNGKVALNIGAIPSHETYQFKGTYISHHNCNEQEISEMKIMLQRFKNGLSKFGMPEETLSLLDKFSVSPAIGITFKVEEIFEQTPKPGTGNKIN